jgi:hypothetical protein
METSGSQWWPLRALLSFAGLLPLAVISTTASHRLLIEQPCLTGYTIPSGAPFVAALLVSFAALLITFVVALMRGPSNTRLAGTLALFTGTFLAFLTFLLFVAPFGWDCPR